jgi:antitoxin component of MazEF toxin-antitoxin module
MEREFDAQIRKVGNSYVVTIPSIIIKKYKLKQGKFVTVKLSTEEDEKTK